MSETIMSPTAEMPSTAGLPWHARIALSWVRRFIPEHITNRAELLNSMRSMASKINALKVEKEVWRQRAFSAERVLNYEIKEGMRTAYERHNKEHGHSLNTVL